MDKISVKDVAFSGYRLLAAKPGVALAWFVFQLVIGLGLSALAISMIGPQMAALQEMSQAGGATDPATAMSLTAQMLPFNFLMLLIMLLTGVITLGAGSRAGFGREGGFGYLRFGKDELRLLVTVIVVGLVLAVIWFITSMISVVGMVAGSRAAASSMAAGASPPAGAMLKALLFATPGILLMVFLGVKLSLAPAQTVAESGIRLFGSWKVTKGNFWRLLGAYLLAAIPVLVVAVLLSVASLAIRGVSFDGDFLASIKALQAKSTSMDALFSPAALFGQLLGAVVNTLFMAALVVPAATAYKTLAGAAAPEDAFGDDDDED